ncbi:MAG: HmuY family protein [Chitinophagaceae bacterium]|nr:HmuY family protein [Chitinophagaceae bacterium]
MKRSLFSFLVPGIAFALVFSTGCKKDHDDPKPVSPDVKTKIDLNASVHTAYFNLTTGEEVAVTDASTNKWDVAFDGVDENIYMTANPLGGGAQIVSAAFEALTEAPADGYLSGDAAFADFTTWANYTGATTQPLHAVLPKAGITIVIKTPAGKYAKIQLLGFYQGNPDTSTPQFADFSTRPAYGYYSIKYTIQTDGSRKF